MPIYEYACPECGTFEVIQSASEKPLKTCPACAEKGKKSQVQKLVSAAAFHLKGTGWYKTDYASKNPASSNSSSGSGSGAGSKGDSKGDSAATSESSAKGAGDGGDGGSSSQKATPEKSSAKNGEPSKSGNKAAGVGACGSGCGCK